MNQGYLLSVYGSLLRLSMHTATSGSYILLSLPRLENNDGEMVPLEFCGCPGKSVESRNFIFDIFLGKDYRSWEVLEIRLNLGIKFLEPTL